MLLVYVSRWLQHTATLPKWEDAALFMFGFVCRQWQVPLCMRSALYMLETVLMAAEVCLRLIFVIDANLRSVRVVLQYRALLEGDHLVLWATSSTDDQEVGFHAIIGINWLPCLLP